MDPHDPATVVEGYLRAIAGNDHDEARRLLADRGFRFVSPITSFDDPDAFIEYMLGVGAILPRMDTRHRFVDGGTVCHVLDVTTTISAKQAQRVVHLANVVDGRIVRIETIFDASDYHRMIGNHG